MKKQELVSALAEKTGLTKTDLNKVVDALPEVVKETCMDKGEEINLIGFGKFVRKVNPAHEGFNPLKREKIQVPEIHTLKFLASPTWKRVIENKKGKK